jgi:hypothetical protein
MATPMSARRSAGASFTPSPVIATMWPSERSASTTRSFVSGDERAMISSGESRSSVSRAASSIASTSAPRTTSGVSPTMPTFRATAAAVSSWSPVMTIMRMLARRHARTASATSGRGGSSSAARPTNVRPVSACSVRARCRAHHQREPCRGSTPASPASTGQFRRSALPYPEDGGRCAHVLAGGRDPPSARAPEPDRRPGSAVARRDHPSVR